MEHYFALMSYGLKDSERAVRRLNFIRGSCNCPSARNSETVTKRRKLVAGYSRMTIKLTEDQLHINLHAIIRIILYDLEEREVGTRLGTTQSHG